MKFPNRIHPRLLAAALSLGGLCLVQAQTEVSAVLAGHASLPSTSTVTAPPDAGPLFSTAGKFTDASRARVDKLNSLQGVTFVGDPKHPRNSGGTLPIQGQAVQGFSGLELIRK